ncbi:MAG: sigma 54-interacting transcriptional regulator, partial [Myxococcales bacterium]|nr:sigma 54-interacting transcriptional regulator [Myxococcales bacterium]
MEPRILVIDDGDRYIELAHLLLREYAYATRCRLSGPCWECPHREGCTLTHAHDWAETQEALAAHPELDVILLDVAFELPEARLLPLEGADLDRRRRLQGLAILDALRRTRPEVPIVLMSSREELEHEDASRRLPADEYLVFAGADAFDARSLGLLIERILARRREGQARDGYQWGDSNAMTRLRQKGRALARTSLPILLLGETGTGKSALAERFLHPESQRSGPFVSVDLSALPQTLVAAELFGVARGAYSGAVDRPGRFEAADGGTLLLDEIGNLSAEQQRMLLLVLQRSEVTRLGENRARSIDVKLIAATNADLEAEVRQGRFRADLYARLNPAARLLMPPLRERRDDLEALLVAFARRVFSAGPNRALREHYLRAIGKPAGLGSRLCFEGQDGSESDPEQPEALRFVLPRASRRGLRAHEWPG